MQSNFPGAMRIELTFEGGKVDDPQDPGGRTNEGVIQRVYSAWRENNKLPAQDVFEMTADERDAIYKLQYADKIKFDGLPAGLDLLVLDGAINSGVGQSVKWVQRALPGYTGKVDGILGEATFRAITSCNDVLALIDAVLDRRTAFLKALKTFRRFGKGWLNRISQLRTIARSWAVGVTAPAPSFHVDMHQKAEISDAKKIPAASPGAGVGGIGATTATLSTQTHSLFDAIKQQITTITFLPHMDAVSAYLDHTAATVAAGLGVTGIVAGAAGGAYYAWARVRASKLHDALDTLPAASAAI